jgi:hypothetical protein
VSIDHSQACYSRSFYALLAGLDDEVAMCKLEAAPLVAAASSSRV